MRFHALSRSTRETCHRSVFALLTAVALVVSADQLTVGSVQRLLTSGPGAEGAPRYSPDGKRIAFTAVHPGGPRRLYVMDANSSAPTWVVAAGNGVNSPTWSPDGTKLAFTRDGSIWMAPVSGGAPRRLTRQMRFTYGPDWSPDGREIAFSAIDGPGVNSNIWTVTPEGVMRQVTTHDDGEWFPRWAPDGSRIAFYSTWGEEMTDIWTVSPQGQGLTRITDHPGEDFRPAWSPDGRWIVFNSRRGGQNDLWLVPSSGGLTRQVTDGHALEIDAHWSPDGRTIVVEYDDSHAQLYSVNVDGSSRQQLSGGLRSHERPAVSPDGRHVAFESDAQSREMNIMVSRIERLNLQFQMKSEAIQRQAAWSPDGLRLLFTNSKGGFFQASHLWIGSIDGPSRQLTTMGDTRDPTWADDGRWVVFRGQGKLWRISPTAGSPEVICATDAPYVPTDFLAASQEVVAYANGEPVAVKLHSTCTTRTLPEFLRNTAGMRFSKNGARVAYLADRDGKQDLYVASADGRNVVRLTNDTGLESWPSWAPDGRAIYFSMKPLASRVATIDASHLRVGRPDPLRHVQ